MPGKGKDPNILKRRLEESNNKSKVTSSTHKKGLGSGSVRHKTIIKDPLKGITKPAIRRLARRGGIKRISAQLYELVRKETQNFLNDLMKDIITYTDHARRKTIQHKDVVYAAKKNDITIFGYN